MSNTCLQTKSDSDDGSETIKELRDEIGQLKGELALVSRGKIQATEYGLVVLEEKQAVKQQYEDLDLLHESSKQELQISKEALESKAQWQKRYSEQDVNHEQSLLQESASREADLTERLAELETDGRHMRQEVSRLRVENEGLHSRHSETGSSVEQFEKERKESTEGELRDIKFREKRLLRDYSELEEENIALQKQNSSLKSSQIEYESFKLENRRLTEEILYLNTNIEDLIRLRDISEKQIEETMQAALECERDQKHQLKKQLDQAMILEREAIKMDLENNSQFHYMEDGYEDEEGVGHPLLRGYERQMRDDNGVEQTNIGQEASDSFSELQSMEVQKLDNQLKQIESEKRKLSEHLEKSHSELEPTRDALQSLSDLNLPPAEAEIDRSQYHHLDEAHQKLYQLVSRYKIQEKKYASVLNKNKDLQGEMEALRAKISDKESKVELQKEVQLMNERNRKQQNIIKDLQGQLQGVHDVFGIANGKLNLTQDELAGVSEDVARLYRYVCQANGVAPNRRIMNDHLEVIEQSRRNGFRAKIASQLKEVSNENGQEKSGDGTRSATNSHSRRSNKHAKFNWDTVACTTLASTLRDQIMYLKRSVEQASTNPRVYYNVDGMY